MNKETYNILHAIAYGKPFEVRPALQKYLSTVTISEKEEVKGTRTDSQRKAYFLWLEQIAEQCVNAGVTADMLFKHTAHISVTKDMLHHSIKTLIKAKWNLESTNDLRKTGHLDEIMDSVASWVGKENIEIPPFPSNETKAWEEIGGYKTKAGTQDEAYPEQDESNLADKF